MEGDTEECVVNGGCAADEEEILVALLVNHYREAIRLGFLGPREGAHLRTRHFADAWGLAKIRFPQPTANWVDLGSGAGLPGLPLAARYSGTRFTLIDSNHRRTEWLKSVVRALALQNVEVVCDRLEEVGRDERFREYFDVAVARALAKSTVVVELGLPLLRRSGVLLIARGVFEDEERRELERYLAILGGKLVAAEPNPADPSGDGVVLVITKVRSTSVRFPRAVGIPQRVPLTGSSSP